MFFTNSKNTSKYNNNKYICIAHQKRYKDNKNVSETNIQENMHASLLYLIFYELLQFKQNYCRLYTYDLNITCTFE